MKILHLTGEREDLGGILAVIRNLQSASATLGLHHKVWVNNRFAEIRQPALDYRFSRHGCSDSPSHFLILYRSLRAFFELNQLLSLEHYDVLHAHTRGTFWVGLGVAGGMNRPVLFTSHCYARRVGMYRWATRQRNFYMTVLTASMARHYGLVKHPPKVNVIPACCADYFFSEPLIQREDLSPNARLRLVGVGNLMRWKNWHLLISALAQLTEVERNRIEISLWGKAPEDPDSQKYEGELRKMVAEFNLENHFLLRGLTSGVVQCLRRANWFVLPSTNEPCSVALLEAMALGLPALVSASGGNVDIVNPGKTGLLFEPGNPNDLVAKIRSILEARTAMAPPADIRASVQCRSATEVTRQYAALYSQLAGLGQKGEKGRDEGVWQGKLA